MMVLLARWFGFQPSEIDAFDVDDLRKWCEQAQEQIEHEKNGTAGG